VDGYVVYVSDSPSVLGQTTVITTPWDSTVINSWLEPGRTYYIVIEAFDADVGWTMRSSRVTGVPQAAGFELTTLTPVVTVAGGGATGLEVRVVRTGDVTPTVFLYGGAGDARRPGAGGGASLCIDGDAGCDPSVRGSSGDRDHLGDRL
jgi:hypothetical protein